VKERGKEKRRNKMRLFFSSTKPKTVSLKKNGSTYLCNGHARCSKKRKIPGIPDKKKSVRNSRDQKYKNHLSHDQA